jgi:hypothetical protein
LAPLEYDDAQQASRERDDDARFDVVNAPGLVYIGHAYTPRAIA